MGGWFAATFVDSGRLPLFCFLVAFLLAFGFIRLSVRMIRAEVPWWPGNVTPGGLHLHHVVFGLVLMLVAGFALITLASFHTPVANAVLASMFGVGAALVLDEFALVLHLRDVYWKKEGRSSIDAVFVALTITALFLAGGHPLGLDGTFDGVGAEDLVEFLVKLGFFAFQLALAVVTLLKGKIWTGLVGLFIAPLLLIGAIRLSRPGAPWARWRYADRPRKAHRAIQRELRWRRPVVRAKVAVQEAIAGRFDDARPS